jgi:hypothetical protein
MGDETIAESSAAPGEVLERATILGAIVRQTAASALRAM